MKQKINSMRYKSGRMIMSGYALMFMIFYQCSGQTEKTWYGNSAPVTHELWDAFLQKYVSEDNRVNYAAINKNSDALNRYLDVLKKAHPNETWTKEERKAYWINAYNAFTLKLVSDHFPLKSIRDIEGSLKSPWDIAFVNIEGNMYSLGDIEHKILRQEFNDPRIHFAINCASFSCPVLHNKAYRAEFLEKQLDDASVRFINDPLRNNISGKHLELSEIFKWFQEDFTKDGDLIHYLNQYARVKISSKIKIKYLTYNWTLND